MLGTIPNTLYINWFNPHNKSYAVDTIIISIL